MEDEGTYLCKADNGLNSLMLDGLKAMMLEISGKAISPILHSERPKLYAILAFLSAVGLMGNLIMDS